MVQEPIDPFTSATFKCLSVLYRKAYPCPPLTCSNSKTRTGSDASLESASPILRPQRRPRSGRSEEALQGCVRFGFPRRPELHRLLARDRVESEVLPRGKMS